MKSDLTGDKWTEIITPQRSLFDIRLREIWKFRHLVYLFVKRDVVTGTKQTILGPLWYLVQPLITTITFTVIFGNIAKISTDGMPSVVFYMLGIVSWGYFTSCLNRTAGTFDSSASLFGKVYFPRLSVPVGAVFSALFFTGIQFFLFFIFWTYYLIKQPGTLHPNLAMLLAPYILFLLASFGMGIGLMVSSITIKFRDVNFILGYVLQLWMYCSPIIYPSSELGKIFGKHASLAVTINKFNPITYLIEIMRYGFLGKGEFSINGLAYSTVVIMFVLFLGIIIFSKTEKDFIDVI